MLLPLLCPGIEQCDSLTRYGIFPVNMRPFVGVAMRARQRHVRHLRLATLRPRQNMVDFKYATTGGKSEESFLVEPGAIGLAPLEEAAHGINQDAQGRLAQWAAGLAE
jgi:hypothetical protein